MKLMVAWAHAQATIMQQNKNQIIWKITLWKGFNMPCYGSSSTNAASLRQLAIQQVAAKFPDLPKESSGWYRAVDNRYKRLCRR